MEILQQGRWTGFAWSMKEKAPKSWTTLIKKPSLLMGIPVSCPFGSSFKIVNKPFFISVISIHLLFFWIIFKANTCLWKALLWKGKTRRDEINKDNVWAGSLPCARCLRATFYPTRRKRKEKKGGLEICVELLDRLRSCLAVNGKSSIWLSWKWEKLSTICSITNYVVVGLAIHCFCCVSRRRDRTMSK